MKVLVLDESKILFQGEAKRVICPGEQGVFEIAPFHRPFMSCLLSGTVIVDDQLFPIERGLAKAVNDEVSVVVQTYYPKKSD